MKRAIITIAVLFSCVLASAQIPVVCESGLNRITHSEAVGSYTLEMKDDLGGGRVDVFALNKTYMLGLLDIMAGVLSGKYPDLIGIPSGPGYIKVLRDKFNGGLLLSYEGLYGTIDAQTIQKFKEAMKAQK